MEAPILILKDLLLFLVSLVLLGGYQGFLWFQSRKVPLYTNQEVNRVTRSNWVTKMMKEGRDVLAIQTLRNFIMASTLLATTSVLLIMGVMTLSAQGQQLKNTWHILETLGEAGAGLWLFKLLLMLLDLFIAFFSFALSIRSFTHVGFMINGADLSEQEEKKINAVSLQLNRGGQLYSFGMRTYYLLVPLVFWLFSSELMLVSTLVLLPIFHHLDKAPREK